MTTGFLELILGPMFSGKTSTLIQLYNRYKIYKVRVCIINYSDDTRYTTTGLSTHDKVTVNCFMARSIKEIIDTYEDKYDIFLINEGQFFKDIFESVEYLVEKKHKRVHIAALDGNYKREPIGNVLQLIPLCDNIQKRKAICVSCNNGTDAIFSKRVTNETSEILIGTDNYKAVCRKCYNESYK